LKVKMCADRETRAADIADLLTLPNFLPKSYGHLRHMGVDLHHAEAVGDLNPDPKVECVTDCSDLSTRSSDDRRAVAGQQIDARVEMQITGKGGFQRERRWSELLDDLSAGNRT
jgi:hypothetical protein